MILQAARELFADRGYAKTTTRDIAKRAHASEVLLFRYFTSKAQLFEEAISEPFDAFMQNIIEQRETLRKGGDGVEMGRNYTEALYRLLLQERQLILSLITTRAYESSAADGGDRPRGLHHYFELSEASLRNIYKDLGITPAVNPALGGRLAFATVVAVALLQDWLLTDLEDVENVPEAIATFVLNGLTGRK